DDGAGKEVRADLLALLEHAHRDVAEALCHLRPLLEQLPDPDRAREARRAGTDDENADVDALVGLIARRGDRVAHRERSRKIDGPDAHARRCFTSSVSFGTISSRSPTTPKSANSKIGALPSLLMATIVPAPCIPTLCWIAPEMPTAM